MITKYSADWYSLRDSAASLYDGGWRAEDREAIRTEYDITNDEELDVICEILSDLAAGE